MNLFRYSQASILTLILMLKLTLSSSSTRTISKAKTEQGESNPLKVKGEHSASKEEEEEEEPLSEQERKPQTSTKEEEHSVSASSVEEEEEEPLSEPESKPKTSKKEEEYTASASSAEEEEKTLPKTAQKRKIGATKKKMAPKITSKEFKSQSTSSEKAIASPIPGTSYQFTSKQQNIPGHKKGGVKTKKTPKIKTSRKVKELKTSSESEYVSSTQGAQPLKQSKKEKKAIEQGWTNFLKNHFYHYMGYFFPPTSSTYAKEHEATEYGARQKEKKTENVKTQLKNIHFVYETDPQEKKSRKNSIKFIKTNADYFGHLFFNYTQIFSILKMLEPKGDIFREIKFGNDNTLKHLFNLIKGINTVNDTSVDFCKYSYRLLFEILKLNSHDLNDNPNLFFKALLEHCLQAELCSIALQHQKSYKIVNIYKYIVFSYQSLLSSKFIESFCIIKRVNKKYVITPYSVTDYKNVRLHGSRNGNHTLEIYPEDIKEAVTYHIGEKSKEELMTASFIHVPDIIVMFYDYKKIFYQEYKLKLKSLGLPNTILEVFDSTSLKNPMAEYKFDSLYSVDDENTTHNVFVTEGNTVELYKNGSKIDRAVPNAFPRGRTPYVPNVLICAKTRQREPEIGYIREALERFNPLNR